MNAMPDQAVGHAAMLQDRIERMARLARYERIALATAQGEQAALKLVNRLRDDPDLSGALLHATAQISLLVEPDWAAEAYCVILERAIRGHL